MVAEGMMDEKRELELVRRAQKGDRRSYGRLVDLYGGLVLAIAYSRIGNYAVSEDIAQDAFLLGFENLAKLRQPHRFGLWLRTITKNLCKDWQRSRVYRERLHRDSSALRERLGYVHSPGADEKLEQREMRNLISESLGNLPLRDRESIILYYFEGKSISEAAKALDISPAAMKKRLERARRRLRDQLTAHVEAGLLEVGRGRKMSSRILAAIPLGASYAKIGTVAAVLPSAPMLHLTGLSANIGGVVMGINKTAAIVAAVCATAIVGAGGLYITRGSRPPDVAPAPQTGLAQSVSALEQLPKPPEFAPRGDSQIAAFEPTSDAELHAESNAAMSIEVAEDPAGMPVLEGGRCVLHGAVTAPDGDPAPEMRMIIARTHDADGNEERDVPVVEATTLHDGSYRAGNLPDGRYVVYAIGPGGTGVEIVFLSSEVSARTRQDILMYIRCIAIKAFIIQSYIGPDPIIRLEIPYEKSYSCN